MTNMPSCSPKVRHLILSPSLDLRLAVPVSYQKQPELQLLYGVLFCDMVVGASESEGGRSSALIQSNLVKEEVEIHLKNSHSESIHIGHSGHSTIPRTDFRREVAEGVRNYATLREGRRGNIVDDLHERPVQNPDISQQEKSNRPGKGQNR